MRSKTIIASALTLLIALAFNGAASAQENDELADAHQELEIARESLEAAAQEVARLSARAAAPVVGGMFRDFPSPGRRAMLGVNIEDSIDGVHVAGVSPGGPADRSGVETGDIIVAIDSAALTEGNDHSPSEVLIAQMEHVDPGDTVALTVRRGTDEHQIDVITTVIESPATFSAFASPVMPMMPGDLRGFPHGLQSMSFARPLGRWADMELVELTPTLGAYFGTEQGILVISAPRDDTLELQDGDVIIEIGGRAPMNTEHAMRILGSFEPGEMLELTIMRDQRRRTLELEIAADYRSG
jgi:S1-C subfamily serine protease